MSNSSPVYINSSEEIRDEHGNGNGIELVRDLTSKVQTLQNAYEEYLDAEQVGVVDCIDDRMSSVH